MATAPAPASEAPDLKRGALHYVSNVVIGVASTAPGYSLAATLGFIIAAVGLQAPAVLILSFIPMLLIAMGFRYLNRANADCGTTYKWGTMAFGPYTGWMGGWGIIAADIIVMASLASIAGIYSFLLVGWDSAAESTGAIAAAGALWIALMTWIAVRGIELSARLQRYLLGAELVALGLFSVVALIKVYGDAPADSIKPALSWFSPFAIDSWSAMVDGVLLGLFIYWGWDSAVSVNEETADSGEAPGKAAVTSTFLLVATYLLVAVAAIAFGGTEKLAEQDDVLATLGKDVLGSPLDKVLIIAVLTSAAASTQTTILPTARATLSMGRDGALPSRFASIHPRFQTPDFSTVLMGAVSLVLFLVLILASTNVLADSLVALGLLICFYYGITGFACAWYYRKALGKSAKGFLLAGVAPFLGGLILLAVFIKAASNQADPALASSGDFLGLGVPFVIGIGALVLGLILMLVTRAKQPAWFKETKPSAAPPDALADV